MEADSSGGETSSPGLQASPAHVFPRSAGFLCSPRLTQREVSRLLSCRGAHTAGAGRSAWRWEKLPPAGTGSCLTNAELGLRVSVCQLERWGTVTAFLMPSLPSLPSGREN